MSYAYAAAEENASGGMTVTSPTMGASGVMPALVRYYYVDKMFERAKIIRALKIAGIIGNLFKHNATISGAQGGCQAEIRDFLKENPILQRDYTRERVA